MFLVLADVLVYVALDRPVAQMVESARQSLSGDPLAWQAEKRALARVEQRAAKLPETRKEVRAFLLKYVPSQREGYSRASTLVERAAQEAGVQLTTVSYKPDTSMTPEPLDRLTMGVRVEGSFAGLMSFSHALETASDLIVVRSFKFQSSSDEGSGDPSKGSGALALQLTADLYLLP